MTASCSDLIRDIHREAMWVAREMLAEHQMRVYKATTFRLVKRAVRRGHGWVYRQWIELKVNGVWVRP